MTDTARWNCPDCGAAATQADAICPRGHVLPAMDEYLSLPPEPLCGAVMATCRNEPGHSGDHWNPTVPELVPGVPDREPVSVQLGQGGLTVGSDAPEPEG
jgi:hypothetical protein